MSTILDAAPTQEDVVISMSRAVSAANRRAEELGIDVRDKLVSASQRQSAGGLVWRVSYGPKDYINRRGGVFIIDVDPADGSIRQELRGQ